MSVYKYPAFPAGSKLHHTNGKEHATVLTECKVMVTMARGEPLREMMSLEDWLILADGATIYGTIPPSDPSLATEEQKQMVRNAADDRAQARAAEAEANADAIRNAREYQTTGSDMAAAHYTDGKDAAPDGSITVGPPFALKPHVIGTMLRWESNDADTQGDYVEAVVTAEGITQLKSYMHVDEHYNYTEGVNISTTKKFFPTYFHWVGTLLWQGTMTMTPPKIPAVASVPDSPPIERKPDEIGTIFRWNSNRGHNEGDYVVAVQTAKGVLQVKSQLSDAEGPTTNTKKTLFPTYNDWVKTLPSCSGVTTTPPDKRTRTERLAAQPLAEGLSDPMKLKAIMQRFKIPNCAFRERSVEEQLATAIGTVNYARNAFNNLPIDRLLADPVHLKLLTGYVRDAVSLARYKSTLTEAEANARKIRMIPNHRRCIRVTLAGSVHYMDYMEDDDKDLIILMGMDCKCIPFTSFREMGVSEITVFQRRIAHTIKL